MKIWAKVYSVAFLLFAFSGLKAQTRYQQLTLGGGAGAAMAYAGAALSQTNIAFYASASYYPVPVFNIDLEAQAGTLSGAPSNKSKSKKKFTDSYNAVILDANLYLGAFFDPQTSGFLNVIRNFYGGVGYSVMANSVNNVDLADIKTTNHIDNTINVVPFRTGYECSILKNRYNEPVLKADFSFTFNYTIGKGLDGYYDSYSKSFNFYNFYAVGLKYTIIVKAAYGKGYNKYD